MDVNEDTASPGESDGSSAPRRPRVPGDEASGEGRGDGRSDADANGADADDGPPPLAVRVREDRAGGTVTA